MSFDTAAPSCLIPESVLADTNCSILNNTQAALLGQKGPRRSYFALAFNETLHTQKKLPRDELVAQLATERSKLD